MGERNRTRESCEANAFVPPTDGRHSLARLITDLLPRTTPEYTLRVTRFPELANPRSTIGTFSLTSFSSLRQARLLSGSIIRFLPGCLHYFSPATPCSPNKSICWFTNGRTSWL